MFLLLLKIKSNLESIFFCIVLFTVPIGIPSNLYAEPYNESAIIVHWDPVPLDRTFMKGQLKGFKVNNFCHSLEFHLQNVNIKTIK
jgi:hypothetical protein